jgi:hydrogenase maturation protease
MKVRKVARPPLTPRAAVLGLGNVLMGDDAFGPYLVRVLDAEWTVTPAVSWQDLGTPGLDLAPYLADLDLVIIVDTVSAPRPPGEVRTYARADLLRHAPGPRLSPHDPGVKEAVLTAELAGIAPRELWIVGVVPGRVGMGTALSPAVQAALPGAMAQVRRLLEERGFAVRPRVVPRPRDIWWEAPAGPVPARA